MKTDFLQNKWKKFKGFFRYLAGRFSGSRSQVHQLDDLNEYDKMKIEMLMKKELNKKETQQDISAI
jgi:hypothetical protein